MLFTDNNMAPFNCFCDPQSRLHDLEDLEERICCFILFWASRVSCGWKPFLLWRKSRRRQVAHQRVAVVCGGVSYYVRAQRERLPRHVRNLYHGQGMGTPGGKKQGNGTWWQFKVGNVVGLSLEKYICLYVRQCVSWMETNVWLLVPL